MVENWSASPERRWTGRRPQRSDTKIYLKAVRVPFEDKLPYNRHKSFLFFNAQWRVHTSENHNTRNSKMRELFQKIGRWEKKKTNSLMSNNKIKVIYPH